MKITNPLKMINNRLLLNYRFDFSFFYLLESLYSIKRIRDPRHTFLFSTITTPIITLPQDYSSLPYYLSFNVFSVLTIILYLFTIILCFCVPYMLYITYQYIIDKRYKVRFIILFISFTCLFFVAHFSCLLSLLLLPYKRYILSSFSI